ncbi:G8 domain-containing protein [uncultured Tenacibaculum sp.]|uniref:G8 domain-containing protein n=1 Tax=uncultured Tenacibaculum sp. TaxID=174713 RepID=UPI00260E6F0C|nr:G8 domain-containing protein [uncultured Tenacibaculum sp.]
MKFKKLSKLFIIPFILITSFINAQNPIQVAGLPTITAINSGNWSNPNTWGGALPQNDDRILIPANITVTVDGMISQEFKSIRIASQGKLQYATNVNTELRTEYLVSEMGAFFEIGTSTTPIASNVKANLVFAWRGGTTKNQDNSRFAPGAVLMGPVIMQGTTKTSWTTLAIHPSTGTNQLTLSTPPTGWKIDDKLVIAGTDINDYKSDELVTINNISGNTVTLKTTLTKSHKPPTEIANIVDVHVSNNTRNIIISSENPSVTALDGTDGYGKPRGHIMFMHNPDVQIRYVETQNLGRTDKALELDDWSVPEEGLEGQPNPRFSTTVPYPAGAGRNPRGRYSIHFHRSMGRKNDGSTTLNMTQAIVEGCVVNNDPGWAYVNHSSNVDFNNNVSYNIVGSAYSTEAGDELGIFRNNIAIRTYNPIEPLNLGRPVDNTLGIHGGRTNGLTDAREGISDFAHQGDGFWLHSCGVTLEGNVVSGASGHAYIYWTEGLWESLKGRPQMQHYVDAYVPQAEYPTQHAELKAHVAANPTWLFDVWYIYPRPFKNNIGYTVAQGFRGDYIMTEFHENGNSTSNEYNMMPTNYRNSMNLVIENTLLWGIRRTGMQFETCAQITLKNNKVYGYGTNTGLAPWNPSPNPYSGRLEVEPHSIGVDLDNYHNTRSWTIENNIIAGWNGESQALTLPINAKVVVNGGTFDNSGTDILIREVNWAKGWDERIVNNTESNTNPPHYINPTPKDLITPWRTINIKGNIIFKNSNKNIVLDAQMHLVNNAGDSFALLHPDGSGVKMTAYFLLPDDIRLNFGSFNNTKLYFNEQEANYIPVPTSDLLTPYLYPAENLFPERVTPNIYLNKSNAQLKSEFGSSFGGTITPKNAITHPMIIGGKIVDDNLNNPDVNSKNNKCLIYPNQASSHFYIKQNDNLSVKIFTLQGKMIKQISSTNSMIKIPELSTGIYLVQIKNNKTGTICTKKLIKS